MTIVCGDSHTSTHGAFGALAFGIGTSEVEHVLATQTLPQARPKTMQVAFDGELPFGLSAKDMVLAAIGRLGVAGGQGHVLEYTGAAIEALSMEGRMTVCNMSIEAGARAGMIAPDDVTFAYLEGRPAAPTGAEWERALERWRCAAHRSRRGLRRRGAHRPGAAEAAGDVGDEPGHGRARRRRRSRPGRLRRSRRARGGRARPALHGPRARHAARRRSGSTRSSSARARTRASRTCAPRRRSRPAGASPRACARSSCPAPRR